MSGPLKSGGVAFDLFARCVVVAALLLAGVECIVVAVGAMHVLAGSR